MADPASNEVLIYKYFHLDNNLERNTLNDYSIFLNTAFFFSYVQLVWDTVWSRVLIRIIN